MPVEPLPRLTQGDPGGFGGYLRDLRRSRGMTQRQLAASSRVDFTYISKLENNRTEHTPSEAALVMLAHAMQADSYALMKAAGKLPRNVVEAVLAMPVEEWRRITGSRDA